MPRGDTVNRTPIADGDSLHRDFSLASSNGLPTASSPSPALRRDPKICARPTQSAFSRNLRLTILMAGRA
jgi:hypothetical protein